MSKPIIAACEPLEVDLIAGKNYAWCACGRSKKQPFCDGSHKQCDIKPVVFKADKTEKVWLCMCKHTSNHPFCDDTHNTLKDDNT
ncbi:MAG: CDGSH iron-sulfur domain-containing protein [Magnetovibrio sp.]|nr:CDGSH iron-sulfur domain-containing protein [Magnetovibrio sp.]